MNYRIEIRIAILGEKGAGKEMFEKMMFLDKCSKIRVDPLSKLARMYVETDPLNFQNGYKKTVAECKEHNDFIMKQSTINLKDMRTANIAPMFFHYMPRAQGLVEYDNNQQNRYINKNILFTFYSIGNNWSDFSKEIESSNIIIYITKTLDPKSALYSYVIDLAAKQKYLITLINKHGHTPTGVATITESNFVCPPIEISLADATIFRHIIFDLAYEINPEDKQLLFNAYGLRKENYSKELAKNKEKYLQQTGFSSFRNCLLDILCSKYRTMVEANYELEVSQFSKKLLEGPDSTVVQELTSLKTKEDKLGKIFKYDYTNSLNGALFKFLDKIVASTTPDIKLLDGIKQIYPTDHPVSVKIDILNNDLRQKYVQSMTKKLYTSQIQIQSYIPSEVYHLFSTLVEAQLSQEETHKLVSYICELYTTKTKELLKADHMYAMVYCAFFDPIEASKLLCMLDEIKHLMDFDAYRFFLLRLWLTKLMIITKYPEKTTFETEDTPETKIFFAYCKALKYYLSDNHSRKYEYLFSNIIDICTGLLTRLGNTTKYINYLYDNLEVVVDFQPDETIGLEKFIIKVIKKINYHAMVADDTNDSDEDSDVDIYGEKDPTNNESNFSFTKDDLTESDDEDLLKKPSKNHEIVEV